MSVIALKGAQRHSPGRCSDRGDSASRPLPTFQFLGSWVEGSIFLGNCSGICWRGFGTESEDKTRMPHVFVYPRYSFLATVGIEKKWIINSKGILHFFKDIKVDMKGLLASAPPSPSQVTRKRRVGTCHMAGEQRACHTAGNCCRGRGESRLTSGSTIWKISYSLLSTNFRALQDCT